MKASRRLIVGLLASVIGFPAAAAVQPGVEPENWAAYKRMFLEENGRIVDNANGNISHSEGQGYGLLLAYLANSPDDFEQIWYFTRTELMVRDDGLAAWRWDPASHPHVSDVNNASDGDVLIAYSLALAGYAWHRDDYLRIAAKIARTLLKEVVVTSKGRTLLLPATDGFSVSQRKDGPVVNPSYWIYEAIPVMAALAPSDAWSKLFRDGQGLHAIMQFGPRRLPADWVSLSETPKPAFGFEKEFGYNSIRIPLYLMRAGIEDKPLLARLAEGMTTADRTPATIDLSTGTAKEALPDPGYRIINHIVACVVDGAQLPQSSQRFTPALYYPSTLQLLGLAFVAEKHPECL
ncbi:MULTISPECIES: glycosyl hydrolase family 8 [Alphaproteobacteria]|uniref:cellulase n=2 Tax=Alphaproteobacteria TaxID=28211 RepID=A0A512HNI9_9HYPH|nr:MULTISPECIES: glycosyl hydrolase family 8 [Alphaproteobacteria]GEO87012.1 endoglucanase [Ciceribacter naphthalenivorans]GLR21612.1 endoglucanase [Ciceribacter naphthalenivorans]GLT04468.1 endoglucanase [Sphingomonas psychrolutea]